MQSVSSLSVLSLLQASVAELTSHNRLVDATVFNRCKKEPYYIEPQAAGSRYIPEQAKPIKPQHSRYIPERQKEARHKRPKGKRCLSIGSMGELISRSMKGTMGTMKRMGSGDLADAGTSLNK